MSDFILDNAFTASDREITDPKEIVRINDLKLDVNESTKKIRYGRSAIYFLAAVNLLYPLVMGYVISSTGPEYGTIVAGALMCVLYLGFAGLTYRWPLVGLVLALMLYLLDHGLAAVEDPASIPQGIFLKIVILYGLGSGIASAVRLRGQLQRLQAYGVPEKELALARELKEVPRTPQIKR